MSRTMTARVDAPRFERARESRLHKLECEILDLLTTGRLTARRRRRIRKLTLPNPFAPKAEKVIRAVLWSYVAFAAMVTIIRAF